MFNMMDRSTGCPSAGGAFIFGVIESAPKLWTYVQENLEKRGKPTGVVMLNYSE